jgi:TonB family protein
MARKAYLIFLYFFLVHIAAAHADGLKDSLNQQYKKHVMVLRSPFTSGSQKFDSNGQSLNPSPKGPWLVYGGIFVEKLSLSSDRLRLQGRRVGFGTDKKKGNETLVALGKTVQVEIRLDKPLKSFNEVGVVLGRVFLEGGSVEQAKPEFRRSDDTTSSEKVYEVKKDRVTVPRATYTPAPEFSDAARRAKFQGTVILRIVVDKAGKVARIRLEKGLGYGLDENAMEGLKAWRFEPGTRDGQTVPVEMNAEVSFNLY